MWKGIAMMIRQMELLRRTPGALRALLEGLDEELLRTNCGGETFSAFDILGHLIHGEQTDWLPRVEHILAHQNRKPFEPFDRFAMYELSRGRSTIELLDEFAALRTANLARLEQLELGHGALGLRGLHPALGEVTMAQLLASWVVHDLGHIAQIARTLAYPLKDEVGPWREYLTILPRS